MNDENLAITAALKGNWDEAIALNLKILEENPENIEVLNRLAHAYIQKGDWQRAKATCRNILSLNPYNPIALRNLKKLKEFSRVRRNGVSSVSPTAFLEEPGKTRVIELVNVACKKTLSALSCGQRVFLKVRRHTIEARDEEKNYLGALPDDVAFRLIKFIKLGNTYEGYIKRLSPHLMVLIKETKRCDRLKNQPSFPVRAEPSLSARRQESFAIDERETTAFTDEEAGRKEVAIPEEE